MSTGNLLYSPNRRSFITKRATTNFKADEFTDPVGEWLKHLCSVVADSVVLCCVVVWHVAWYSILHIWYDFVYCILCGLEACGKISIQCFIMSGVW